MRTLDRHIEITPGVLGGKPRIAGRRISVLQVASMHEWQGWSADEIAAEYDLNLAEIYAALAYYYDHREEMDAEAQAEADFLAEFEEQIKTKTIEFIP